MIKWLIKQTHYNNIMNVILATTMTAGKRNRLEPIKKERLSIEQFHAVASSSLADLCDGDVGSGGGGGESEHGLLPVVDGGVIANYSGELVESSTSPRVN